MASEGNKTTPMQSIGNGNGQNAKRSFGKKHRSVPLAVQLHSCIYRPKAVKQRHLPIRSKFVFLVPKNSRPSLRLDGKLAFCSRWLQKENWKSNELR